MLHENLPPFIVKDISLEHQKSSFITERPVALLVLFTSIACSCWDVNFNTRSLNFYHDIRPPHTQLDTR